MNKKKTWKHQNDTQSVPQQTNKKTISTSSNMSNVHFETKNNNNKYQRIWQNAIIFVKASYIRLTFAWLLLAIMPKFFTCFHFNLWKSNHKLLERGRSKMEGACSKVVRVSVMIFVVFTGKKNWMKSIEFSKKESENWNKKKMAGLVSFISCILHGIYAMYDAGSDFQSDLMFM